ncbi:hypothetical protein MMC28_010464 [Mycoblastus sanguinarius]|nr:hypothetical protein [Mycoblastus sanguinarius]
MNGIPQEVLNLIICKSSDEKWPPIPEKDADSVAFIKALRLCSKKLAIVAAEHLYKEVLLHFTEESYAKMEAISHHPTYKLFVRGLHIVPKSISGPRLDREKFEQWLRGERLLVDGEDVYCHSQATFGPRCFHLDIPKSIDLTPEVIDSHFIQYSSLYCKQEELLHKAESMLQTAVGHFSHLNRVESGLDWYYNRRKQDDTQSNEAIIDREWKYKSCQYKFDVDQGVMVLRAVAKGRTFSGSQLHAGQLFRDLDTMIMEIPDPEERALIHQLMSNAKIFKHIFNGRDIYGVNRLINSGECATFLQNMEQLECLSLQFPPMFTINISSVMGSATWPHLTSLCLVRLSVDYSDLNGLLRRHKPTLKCLTLRDLWLQDEDWYAIFADLRGAALNQLRPCLMSSHNSSGKSSETAFDQDVYSDYLTSTHPLYTFLFGDEPCSLDIPAALLELHVSL